MTPSTEGPPESEMNRSVPLEDIDGWIFDLDGVLTDTASLHEQAWTELFQHLFDSMSSSGPLRRHSRVMITVAWSTERIGWTVFATCWRIGT